MAAHRDVLIARHLKCISQVEVKPSRQFLDRFIRDRKLLLHLSKRRRLLLGWQLAQEHLQFLDALRSRENELFAG